MKKVIVTGAAGFTGCNLVEQLLKQNYRVYAIVRPHSAHNSRLKESDQLHTIPLDFSEYDQLPQLVQEQCDIFFHLTWQGERYNFHQQYQSMEWSIKTLEAAAKLGCRRFVCTGSQAEYGRQENITTENTLPKPDNAYGSAKLAACCLTKQLAGQLGIEWIWGRIFSTYGKYEPAGRMLPDLINALLKGKTFNLTSATQDWDYLYSTDAAEALIALAERGRDGEIYNIANGDYRPLKTFTEEIRQIVAPNVELNYSNVNTNLISLRPSVEKIKAHTGWSAQIKFADGIVEQLKSLRGDRFVI